MSATENAMARFLFAILQQKSLKDVSYQFSFSISIIQVAA